jgi:hypothetical protein
MAKASQRGEKGGGGALGEAWRLYEAGDKVGARREARQVLGASPPPSDADRAEGEDLIARTRPPAWTWPYVAAAAAVLALMLALAITRG